MVGLMGAGFIGSVFGGGSVDSTVPTTSSGLIAGASFRVSGSDCGRGVTSDVGREESSKATTAGSGNAVSPCSSMMLSAALRYIYEVILGKS